MGKMKFQTESGLRAPALACILSFTLSIHDMSGSTESRGTCMPGGML